MLLIFLLDLTLDRKSADSDPMKIMNSVLELQTTVVETLAKLHEELGMMP